MRIFPVIVLLSLQLLLCPTDLPLLYPFASKQTINIDTYYYHAIWPSHTLLLLRHQPINDDTYTNLNLLPFMPNNNNSTTVYCILIMANSLGIAYAILPLITALLSILAAAAAALSRYFAKQCIPAKRPPITRNSHQPRTADMINTSHDLQLICLNTHKHKSLSTPCYTHIIYNQTQTASITLTTYYMTTMPTLQINKQLGYTLSTYNYVTKPAQYKCDPLTENYLCRLLTIVILTVNLSSILWYPSVVPLCWA